MQSEPNGCAASGLTEDARSGAGGAEAATALARTTGSRAIFILTARFLRPCACALTLGCGFEAAAGVYVRLYWPRSSSAILRAALRISPKSPRKIASPPPGPVSSLSACFPLEERLVDLSG